MLFQFKPFWYLISFTIIILTIITGCAPNQPLGPLPTLVSFETHTEQSDGVESTATSVPSVSDEGQNNSSASNSSESDTTQSSEPTAADVPNVNAVDNEGQNNSSASNSSESDTTQSSEPTAANVPNVNAVDNEGQNNSNSLPSQETEASLDLSLDNPVILSGERQAQIEPDVITEIESTGVSRVIINVMSIDEYEALSDIDRDLAIAQRKADILSLLNLPESQIHNISIGNSPAMSLTVTQENLEALRVALDNPNLAAIDYVYVDRPMFAQIEVTRDTLGLTSYVNSAGQVVTGAGTTIALLDAGIDPNYAVFNFGIDIINLGQETCFLNNPSACDGELAPNQSYSHGTLMGAVLKGIAPDTQLVDVQVLSPAGVGFYSDWLNGLAFVLDNHQALGINVVNASLSTEILYAGECESVYPDAASLIRQLRREGVLVVSSTGNFGNAGAVGAPACLVDTVAVGATHQDGILADGLVDEDGNTAWDITNRSRRLDFLAPGLDIAVDYDLDGIVDEIGSGTSQATAITSAVIALMYEVQPQLLPNQVLNILRTEGTPIAVGILPDIDALSHTAYFIRGNSSLSSTEDVVFSCTHIVGIPVEECQYLQTLFDQTGGSAGTWIDDTGWLDSLYPCTDWAGIICSDDSTHVTTINLRRNGLGISGEQFGRIPTGISVMTRLSHLYLDGNSIESLPDDIIAMSDPDLNGNLIEMGVGYNKINPFSTTLSPEMIMTLTMLDPDWRATQAYYPEVVIALTTSNSPWTINVQWNPSPLTDVRYDILCKGNNDGIGTPIQVLAPTRQIEINNLQANVGFECRVRVFSPASANNPNDLLSAYSPVNLNSTALTTLDGLNNQSIILNPNEASFIALYHQSAAGNVGRGFVAVGSYDDPNDGEEVGVSTLAEPLYPGAPAEYIGDLPYDNSVAYMKFGVFNSPLPVDSVEMVFTSYGARGAADLIIMPATANWSGHMGLFDAYDASIIYGSASFAETVQGDFSRRTTIPLDISIMNLFAVPNNGIVLRSPDNPALGGSVICDSLDGECPAGTEPELRINLSGLSVTLVNPEDDERNVSITPVFGWLTTEISTDVESGTFTLRVGKVADGNPSEFVIPNIPASSDPQEAVRYQGITLDYAEHYTYRVDFIESDGNVVVGEASQFYTNVCDPNGEVPLSECQAIVGLYNNNSWADLEIAALSNWLTVPVCDLVQVTCFDGHITGLNLANLGLAGDDLGLLANLLYLHELNLSNNNFNTQLPDLSNLSSLEVIIVDNNNIQGALPGLNAGSVRIASFAHNDFTGAIPASYGTFESLTFFNVEDNNLEENPLTLLVNVPTLEEIYIGQNLFSGAIPETIDNLQSLQVLSLPFNNYGGAAGFLPIELMNLPELRSNGFVFDFNALEVNDDDDGQLLSGFITEHHTGTWQSSQTTPMPMLLHMSLEDGNGFEFEWENREYPLPNSGRYGIVCNQFQFDANTDSPQSLDIELDRVDQIETSYIYDRLLPDTPYTCLLLAIVPASGQQKNTIYSRVIVLEDMRTLPIPEEYLTGGIDNPIIIEAYPYNYAIAPELMLQREPNDPLCLTDEDRPRSSTAWGMENTEGRDLIRITLEGVDGANPELSFIAVDQDGNLVHEDCENSINNGGVNSGTHNSDGLALGDVVYNFYPEPGLTYIIIPYLAADGESGPILMTVEDLTFHSCEQTDVSLQSCQTLVDFYLSTEGGSWRNSTGWRHNANVCEWFGVSCNENNEIIGLELPDNLIRGSLPDFSPLINLKTLDLEYNQLTGDLSTNLAGLQLETLNLSYNHLQILNRSMEASFTALEPELLNTQTIWPDNILAQNIRSSTVDIVWDTIHYAGSNGHYELCYTTDLHNGCTTDAEFVQVGPDKDVRAYTIPGLAPHTDYYVFIRTVSIEAIYRPRTITSPRSPAILITTTGNYPDADGDGIYDRYDECPWQASEDGLGIDETGCPYYDADRDGIYDRYDECPWQASEDGLGIDETGCPYYDADRDGIYDRYDECPWQASEGGLGIDEDGCPYYDADGDGVPDDDDECPWRGNEYGGGVDETGCPIKAPDEDISGTEEAQADATEESSRDADGDSFSDRNDTCPWQGDEGGLGVDETGCPYYDADWDGVYDRDDSCVWRGNEYGLGVDEAGCPIEDNFDENGYATEEPYMTEEPQQ